MTRSRLLRWSGSLLSPRTRPPTGATWPPVGRRYQATAVAASEPPDNTIKSFFTDTELRGLPSPPVTACRTSAKLAALHARLSLSSRVPLETLARTLVDYSADPSIRFNNRSFAALGNDILGFYSSEHILSHYPRLPLAVVFAAMYAYHGPTTLTALAREWGVEAAAAPGGEVDPGLLQFKRVPPEPKPERPQPDIVATRDEGAAHARRTMSSRSVYDDQFGESKKLQAADDNAAEGDATVRGVSLQRASTNFVRAVFGAVYLHAGRAAAKRFYHDHILSRQLDMASLFQIKNPTRDLSRLCAREGFKAPVARLISETGRRSRTPVFVVGIYSGNDLLGEGVGASLDEARTRAAVAALKGWYLYSPPDVRLPSEMEEHDAPAWTPIHIDPGDIAT